MYLLAVSLYGNDASRCVLRYLNLHVPLQLLWFLARITAIGWLAPHLSPLVLCNLGLFREEENDILCKFIMSQIDTVNTMQLALFLLFFSFFFWLQGRNFDIDN